MKVPVNQQNTLCLVLTMSRVSFDMLFNLGCVLNGTRSTTYRLILTNNTALNIQFYVILKLFLLEILNRHYKLRYSFVIFYICAHAHLM
jgi:hypothetical protein